MKAQDIVLSRILLEQRLKARFVISENFLGRLLPEIFIAELLPLEQQVFMEWLQNVVHEEVERLRVRHIIKRAFGGIVIQAFYCSATRPFVSFHYDLIRKDVKRPAEK